MLLRHSSKEVGMRATSWEIFGMDRVNFITRMEGCMMENGSIIKWMVTDLFTISQGRLLMRGCGEVICSKEKGSSTTNLQKFWRGCLIGRILMKLMSIGSSTKVYVCNSVGDFVEDLKTGKGKLMLSNG
jgi:hypothetical protein